MEVERCASSGGRKSWWSNGAVARWVLMPWTCRKERPSTIHQRAGGGGGGGSAALIDRRRHRVHPSDVDAAVAVARRGAPVRGRRVWRNLFPVNGRSTHESVNR